MNSPRRKRADAESARTQGRGDAVTPRSNSSARWAPRSACATAASSARGGHHPGRSARSGQLSREGAAAPRRAPAQPRGAASLVCSGVLFLGLFSGAGARRLPLRPSYGSCGSSSHLYVSPRRAQDGSRLGERHQILSGRVFCAARRRRGANIYTRPGITTHRIPASARSVEMGPTSVRRGSLPASRNAKCRDLRPRRAIEETGALSSCVSTMTQTPGCARRPRGQATTRGSARSPCCRTRGPRACWTRRRLPAGPCRRAPWPRARRRRRPERRRPRGQARRAPRQLRAEAARYARRRWCRRAALHGTRRPRTRCRAESIVAPAAVAVAPAAPPRHPALLLSGARRPPALLRPSGICRGRAVGVLNAAAVPRANPDLTHADHGQGVKSNFWHERGDLS